MAVFRFLVGAALTPPSPQPARGRPRLQRQAPRSGSLGGYARFFLRPRASRVRALSRFSRRLRRRLISRCRSVPIFCLASCFSDDTEFVLHTGILAGCGKTYFLMKNPSATRQARGARVSPLAAGGGSRERGSGRLRKKAFRTLLSLSVISPRGGELNTSGAERRSELTSPRGANQNTSGAERRSELTSPRGANQNTSGAERRSELASPRGANQKRKEASFIAGGGKIFHGEIGF